MIIELHDVDGDPVAIESTAILAVRVGHIERDADIFDEVTLISLPSCTIAVREQLVDVLARWRSARPGGGFEARQTAAGWQFLEIQRTTDLGRVP